MMLKFVIFAALLTMSTDGYLNEGSTYPFSVLQLKQSSIKNLKQLYCEQFPRALSCSQPLDSEEELTIQLYKCLFNPSLPNCPGKAVKTDEYEEMKREKANSERKRREIIERFVF